jgi:DNA-binding CsgD family transcriptional regulator
MSMMIRTDRDFASGVTTVWLSGDLTWATVSTVRVALAKCVVDHPVAVIVELSGLRAASSALLSVFPTAARRAARDQAVPLLLCAAGRDVAGLLAASRTSVQVYASHDEAVAAVRDGQPRWAQARMAPAPVSASLARGLVGDACLAWNVPHLYEPARLVVSELVANAVEHAGGDIEVNVALVGRYLRIGVRDHSRVAPRLPTAEPPNPLAPLPDRGRGLSIVHDYATQWGATALDDGKIVWALLAAYPAIDPGVMPKREAADASRPPTAIAAQPTSLAQLAVDRLSEIRAANRSATSAGADSLEASQIRPERLTEREVDVVRQLPTMLTVGEIALELNLSISTVKAHMKSIYRKLNASRRREAVDRAYELGVIAPTTTPADATTTRVTAVHHRDAG